MSLVKENLLVVKVGTNTLVDASQRCLNEEAFRRIGDEIRDLTDEKTGIVLVSSGAITAGAMLDGRRRGEVSEMVELQRYAARGWDEIVQRWKAAIGADRVSAALLTKQELLWRNTQAKALNVIGCSLVHGDVFLVNENDTICDDEIRFGDNDTLAAELAASLAASNMFHVVRLILLTNRDGLCKVADDNSTLLRVVTDIENVRQFAGAAENGLSCGGMVTKIASAQIAMCAGVETFIANGRESTVISRALAAEIGTRFVVTL
ncbi:hypothetical protein FWG95_01330 [Candidatus Saccharibacteria bacterium]|nr:hypothetical protein [Candidatus Saccharibacteria bacterium]